MGILRDNVYVLDGTRTEQVTTHTSARVEITEKRAPTDESVRLLREMEDAARKQVDLAIHVGNTTFECVVHRARDFASCCVHFRAIFKLNGVQRTAEHIVRDKDVLSMEDTSQAMRALRDKIATVIATEMIYSALDSGCFDNRV